MTSATQTPEKRPPAWVRSAETLRVRWMKETQPPGGWCRDIIRDLLWDNRLCRLFGVACCRCPDVWARLIDPRGQTAVEVAEQFADGALEPTSSLNRAKDAAWVAHKATDPPHHHSPLEGAANICRRDVDAGVVGIVAMVCATPPDRLDILDYQARLLVAFVGPGWALPASCRTDTAVALARAMYDAREFSAMPILADAIQDAGADESGELLTHLRDPDAVWARGARVLDELLGKR